VGGVKWISVATDRILWICSKHHSQGLWPQHCQKNRMQTAPRIALKSRLPSSLNKEACGGRPFAQQQSQHDRRRIFRKATQRFASRRPLRLLSAVVARPRLTIVAHDPIPILDSVELCISRFDLASRRPSRQLTRPLRIPHVENSRFTSRAAQNRNGATPRRGQQRNRETSYPSIGRLASPIWFPRGQDLVSAI
jgi:hypothetical protein